MYYRNKVIRYLQANNILALKLDRAVTGVRKAVSNQIDMIQAGATRALYYTSCFTDEYMDVCQQQKTEDIRFKNGVIHFIQHGNVIYDMLKLYFEEVFKYKTSVQIDHIKKLLMAVNVHIAASTLTNAGFALAVASTVAIGMKLSLEMSTLVGEKAVGVLTGVGLYGVVEKAANGSRHLHYTNPAFWNVLYIHELDMMYFLIEPLFEQENTFKTQYASDNDIANMIARMIR